MSLTLLLSDESWKVTLVDVNDSAKHNDDDDGFVFLDKN